MSLSMITKFDKYWSDIQGLMGIATLLDPRLKKLSLLMCFEWLTGTTSHICQDKVDETIDLLTELMIEYHVEEECENNSELAAAPVGDMEFLSSFSARVASTRPSAIQFKYELDHYLEDELVSLETKGFKVLDWWKVAGVRYPTLRRIARDIYAIPITTVASESAFSTSGRVLSEHRSRLTSMMIEALMCSQDWLKNKYKIDEKEKQVATFWSCLQDIQEGLQKLEL
ncbi:zinc finger BED domain-containing protein RICESLEEPER 3-like [Oryza brachyantha]|uniref:zinc finger BED domain-containing protein RICESLEEPER 3-like n=1 Tax=Oryza brachyantha TaxID=4533 RepID=UPI001ADA9F1C|nr:zinc finger BED domain-containing protein RICESLEEPER 3-like [Oryza brachyantha]